MWLDATNVDGDDTEDSIAAGTAIVQWIDKSGNNNHAGQATASNRPIYGLRSNANYAAGKPDLTVLQLRKVLISQLTPIFDPLLP